MIKTFMISFRLKNTYRANSMIYSLKGLPIVHHLLPDSLYKHQGLKTFAHIISILLEIINTFLGKYLYCLVMIFFMSSFYQTNQAYTFLHIFIFLTIAGGLLNTYMFNPTKDKYYAIILMNIDTNKYAVSNYLYTMLKVFIGFMPIMLYFSTLIKLPLWIFIIMPIYVVMIKMIVIFLDIEKYKKKGIATNENLPTKTLWFIVGLLVILAYGLPLLGIIMPQIFFIIFFICSLLLGIYSFIVIFQFNDYKKLYKMILTIDNINVIQNSNSTETIKNNIAKTIELNPSIQSHKEGFSYFHELFVKRHKKILTQTVKKQTFIILLIIGGILIFAYAVPKIKIYLNNITLTYLPYFVLIMYFLNKGTTITQAMFINCDHCMLTYRIFRTPKVLLGIFTQRLKTLIFINLLPSSILGLGLTLILYITGGTTNPLNYLILFISINTMSVFFSIHYLSMYYLLQPYNISTEIKNSTYSVVKAMTYFICYFMIQIKLPIFEFGIATIIFTIIYTIIALILIYKFAPKTFKIRQ